MGRRVGVGRAGTGHGDGPGLIPGRRATLQNKPREGDTFKSCLREESKEETVQATYLQVSLCAPLFVSVQMCVHVCASRVHH